MLDRLILRHFFDGLAIGGALAEWALACWVLAGLGAEPPALLHVTVPPLLAVANRLAARTLAREPRAGRLAQRTAYGALATAFAALVGAGVLVVVAGVWASIDLLALRAEAGALAPPGGQPLFSAGFRFLATGMIALAGAAVAYGYAHGYRRLVVTEVTVPVTGLPPPLGGLRVVHVSDLHVGPLADRAALRQAIDRVAALDPDVVCVTGDIVDSPATNLDAWGPELGRLTARHGVFAVLGNHDLHAGTERVVAALARWTRWRLLRDEVATLVVGGAPLHLVGLEERPDGAVRDDLSGLLARVPAGEPAILLAHRPAVFPAAAAARVPLTLSGHTHGGQVAVPGAPRINVARLLITRFDAGVFERDGAVLYVSRGLGTSGQRVRIGVPSEITVVTLVPRERAEHPALTPRLAGVATTSEGQH
jgi:predicted MPP superfamily phosphohydrolase